MLGHDGPAVGALGAPMHLSAGPAEGALGAPMHWSGGPPAWPDQAGRCPLPPHQKWQGSPLATLCHQLRLAMAAAISADSLPGRTQQRKGGCRLVAPMPAMPARPGRGLSRTPLLGPCSGWATASCSRFLKN